MRQETF